MSMGQDCDLAAEPACEAPEGRPSQISQLPVHFLRACAVSGNSCLASQLKSLAKTSNKAGFGESTAVVDPSQHSRRDNMLRALCMDY